MTRLLSFNGAGVRLVASAYGDPSAPPILFLHATCQSRRMWKNAARLVAERGFLGITPDLRGHGDSGFATDGNYSLQAFASDIVAIIDRYDQPVTIVGNSLGGWTALAAGAQRPDRIRLLVSFDAAASITLPEDRRFYDFFELAARGFETVEQAASEMEVRFDRPIKDLERFRTRFTEINGRLFFRWDPKLGEYRRAQAPEDQKWLLDLLQGYDRPTVLMVAEHNSLVSPTAVRELVAAVPTLAVERWKGTRHGMTTRDSVRIAERVLLHLERLGNELGPPGASALA